MIPLRWVNVDDFTDIVRKIFLLISLYVILGPTGLDTGIWNLVLFRRKVLNEIRRIDATVC